MLYHLTSHRDLGLELVDIHVGPLPKPTHFRIHKHLLCSRVPYFAKMFNSGFIESEQNLAKLSDVDPSIFALFIEYLYGNGRLPPVDIKVSTTNSGPVIDRIKLYGFAEKICLTTLADYLITNLISNLRHYERSPSREGILLTYQVTRPGSPLRQFMAASLYFIMRFDTEETPWSSRALAECLRGEGTEDLVVDLVRITRRLEVEGRAPHGVIGGGGKGSAGGGGVGTEYWGVDPRRGSKCRWHTHERGVECGLQGEIL
ncbi:hypothetical protein BGZ60DRAFT_5201 [Tricladium varicosporioides]|nr:hypothetical protein BGZ60DRAFT_5201 [Hymenoscyphus varicosporioides]